MMCIISKERIAFCAQVEGTRGEIFATSPIAFQMHACTQWTHSDVWSQLAPTPECLFKIGDRQSEKNRWTSDWRGICNATRGIETGCGVIRHRGVSDGSDGARPLWRSLSARTETFFADDWLDTQGELRHLIPWIVIIIGRICGTRWISMCRTVKAVNYPEPQCMQHLECFNLCQNQRDLGGICQWIVWKGYESVKGFMTSGRWWIGFRKCCNSFHAMQRYMLSGWESCSFGKLYVCVACQRLLVRIGDLSLLQLFGDRYVAGWKLSDECLWRSIHRHMAIPNRWIPGWNSTSVYLLVINRMIGCSRHPLLSSPWTLEYPNLRSVLRALLFRVRVNEGRIPEKQQYREINDGTWWTKFRWQCDKIRSTCGLRWDGLKQ